MEQKHYVPTKRKEKKKEHKETVLKLGNRSNSMYRSTYLATLTIKEIPETIKGFRSPQGFPIRKLIVLKKPPGESKKRIALMGFGCVDCSVF